MTDIIDGISTWAPAAILGQVAVPPATTLQGAVERREMDDYPKRDLTPEHTKRGNGHDSFSNEPTHPDVVAAYDYVDSRIDAADIQIGGSPAWYGWALREAFLAGVSHTSAPPAPTPENSKTMLFYRDGMPD